jgi:hypothetical protein
MYKQYHASATRAIGKLPNPPLRLATWESVLECAEWELKKAKLRNDTGRVAQLKRTIIAARIHVQCGDPFPIGPFSLQEAQPTNA